MEEYSGYAVSIPLQDHCPQNGWTQPGSNLYKFTKWMNPTKGQKQSTKWTDPTRVTNLYKSTKWTDPTKGHDLGPRNGRTQPGSQTYTSPRSGQTLPRVMTPDRIMDGPNHINNLYMSTTWTNPTAVKTQVHDVDG